MISKILPAGIMPCIALRFTGGDLHRMDELSFHAGNLSDRISRNKIQVLSPSYDANYDDVWLQDQPEAPTLPTPTDVPVPEPHDIPVPEPMDVPPPEPHDVPPPKESEPEYDPRPRSIP
jgi:hypothetical protein